MISRPAIIAIITLTLGLFAFASVQFYQMENPHRKLPIYGEVIDFRLKDTAGKEFALKDFRGKIWVADMFFTTCGSICPVMTKNMASLHRSYHLVPDVEFVSITVNPEQDTPEVLAQFARKYMADLNRWRFLSGTREEITNLTVRGFKMGSIEEPIFHSPHFVLVDRKGRIRGYYDGTADADVRKIFKDIALLTKEK